MIFFDSKNGLPSFWKIQITGWLVYLVAIYITFLTVVPPENYLSLFYVKAFWQTSPKPLKIKISARLDANKLFLEVSNTGNLQNGSSRNGSGIGLKNVRERLDKLFGANGKFELNQENGFVKARIEISNEIQNNHR